MLARSVERHWRVMWASLCAVACHSAEAPGGQLSSTSQDRADIGSVHGNGKETGVGTPSAGGPEAGVAAAIAGGDADTLECFGHYYGVGVPKDWPRARACFAREVQREGACGGQSPDLPRVFLAAMEVFGQGGPAARPQAAALLEDCFDDVTVEALRDAAHGQPSRMGHAGRPDPCRDLPGTTYLLGQCARMKAIAR